MLRDIVTTRPAEPAEVQVDASLGATAEMAGAPETVRAQVRRRRRRVNFRQRYESRGVDRYRDVQAATAPLRANTLNVWI